MATVNAITEARLALAGLLAEAVAGTDYRAVDHVPEELPTPCLVLDAAEDYLVPGETFRGREWWVTFRVYALVLPALAGTEWALDGLGRPGPFHTAEWLAHGIPLTVRNLITITTTPGEQS